MTRSARTAVWAGVASAAAVLSLRPLVVSSGWVVGALAVVFAVTGAGVLVRGLTRRTGVAVLAQAVVLLTCLVVVFGGSTTLLGIIPTGATFGRIGQLFADGVQVVQRYSVPAVDLRGLRLLLVTGAGLTAFTVDLFAVTLRRPALAGLPLAIVVGVALALAPGGSSAVSFVVVAVPYLVLLAVGRREGGWAPAPRRSRSSATATATAAAALVVAIALPAALPGLDERPLTIDTGPGDTIAVINPILNLKASLGARSDATILTYQTDQANPAPLRIVTADVFDGETWAPSTGADIPRSQRVQDGLSAPPGLSDQVRAQSVPHTTSISVRGLDQTYLPLPYPATRVDIEGDWLYETDSLNVVGDGETTRNRSYTVSHLEVTPTEDQLRSAPAAPEDVQARYTELPESLPQIVRDTAEQVTAGSTDAYQRAAALQRYFRSTGGFTYSTTAPNDGGADAVATFLQEKTGFCVQYASAMAVMARALGIPARVAIGFLPGEETADGRWRISAQDAHAWPELYFAGTGWVRFEPTPATRTGQAPGYSLPAQQTTPTNPTPTAAATPTAPAPSASATTAAPTTTAGSTTDTGTTGWERFLALPWAWILTGIGVALLLLAPWVTATVLGRRRWAGVHDGRSSAEAAWADLQDRLGDLGVDTTPSTTPRQRAAELVAAHDLPAPAVQELTRLREAVESSRFGAGSHGVGAPAPRSGGGTAVLEAGARTAGRSQGGRLVRSQVDVVVEAVAATRPARSRWRARWFPLAGLRRAMQWWDRD